MIGLGVGIDYALFILTRFREAYSENGGEVHEAVALAMDTAGRAVLFAGATVVIALLGMFALGVSFLYGLAIAASVAVLLVLRGVGDAPAGSAHLLRPPGRRARPARAAAAPARQGGTAGVLGPLDRADPAPPGGRGGGRDARDAHPRGAGALAAARLERRRGTTRPRSRRAAPSTCSRGASAPASTGRSRSSSRCRGTVVRPSSGGSRPPSARRRMSPRSRRPGSAPTARSRRSAPIPSSSPAEQCDQRSRRAPARKRASRRSNRQRARRCSSAARPRPSSTSRASSRASSGCSSASSSRLSALLLLVVFRSLLIPLQAALMNLLSIGASLGVVVACLPVRLAARGSPPARSTRSCRC